MEATGCDSLLSAGMAPFTWGRTPLVGATRQSMDAREQLFKGEGLGQVIICPRIQRIHLVPEIVTSSEHEDRQARVRRPDLRQNRIAAQRMKAMRERKNPTPRGWRRGPGRPKQS